MKINFDLFWENIERYSLSSESVALETEKITLADRIFYSGVTRWGDVKEQVLSIPMNTLTDLYEEIHKFQCMEADDSEDFEDQNSYQAIMELNRIHGIANLIRSEKSAAKRRLL